MQSWEDPIADARTSTSSANAPAVFIDPLTTEKREQAEDSALGSGTVAVAPWRALKEVLIAFGWMIKKSSIAGLT